MMLLSFLSVLIFCGICVHTAQSSMLYWNNETEIEIDVHLNDELDFVCTTTQLLIYQVSQSEYDTCNVSKSQIGMLLNCTGTLNNTQRYTIIFDSFNPFGGFQFAEGNSYYYVGISDFQCFKVTIHVKNKSKVTHVAQKSSSLNLQPNMYVLILILHIYRIH